MASLSLLRRAAAASYRLLLPHPLPDPIRPPTLTAALFHIQRPHVLRLQRSHLYHTHFPEPNKRDIPEEEKSELQRLLDKYCFLENRKEWRPVVAEILRLRRMREEGQVPSGADAPKRLVTRNLLTGEYDWRKGGVGDNAELWREIMKDYVPFSYKRDYGEAPPQDLLLVAEELGDMCVRGEIQGDNAYRLASFIAEDMGKEVKRTKKPEVLKEEKKKSKKSEEKKKSKSEAPPQDLLLVAEELGDMCVRGEIQGDNAYRLASFIAEDMGKEVKRTKKPEVLKEEKKKSKKSEEKKKSKSKKVSAA